MHPSNLQIKNYFLTHLDFSANQDFDPESSMDLAFDDIEIGFEKNPLNEGARREWEVTLSVQCNPARGKNIPYAFAAQIVGFFEVSNKVEDEAIEFYLDTNATSVLYSTLRELISTVTAKGPFTPLLLPTVSFYDPKTSES